MLRVIMSIMTLLLTAAPAAAQMESKIAIVDFERALAECIEGKQASDKFNVRFEERKKTVDGLRKALEDAENALRTQDRSLNNAARAERVREIERRRVEVARASEDAQKELETLRADLLRPISEKAGTVMNVFVQQQGFTLVIDISRENNVVYHNPAADITADLIKRIDAEASKPEPKKP